MDYNQIRFLKKVLGHVNIYKIANKIYHFVILFKSIYEFNLLCLDGTEHSHFSFSKAVLNE